jgi:ribosomal protein S18 acetylase RimI-like enzyme
MQTSKIKLIRLWGGTYGIERQIESPSPSVPDWVALIEEALAQAQGLGAQDILFRLIEAPDSPALSAALPLLDFRKKHDRLEFRASLETLPDDRESPITWRPVVSLGEWTLEDAARFVEEVRIGDPDFDPSENTRTWMEDWLNDPVLTSGANCLEVGFVDGQPVALVVSQINPKTGWSRITYMGMIPSYRGRGLGAWVHRHGFAMLKAQGGALYHGGTVATNRAMIRLFELHGCPLYRRMEEWTYRF